MAIFNMQNPLVFTFGVLGNLVALSVFLAPAPTFYMIVKKKSTEGFHSVPYIVASLSSMLWLYYALLKSNETLLITINSIGFFIEAIYISIYIAYASKKARISTLKLLLLLNFVGFGSILVITQLILKEHRLRVQVLGWISVAFSASVYIAPLSIMKHVVRTKSVEFMPISLSFALLLNAVMWFFYGLLLKDFYITVPNIVGFIFGLLQIILYLIYKNCKVDTDRDKLPTIIKPKTTTYSDAIHPVCSLPIQDGLNLEVITISKENGSDSNLEAKQGIVDDHENSTNQA